MGVSNFSFNGMHSVNAVSDVDNTMPKSYKRVATVRSYLYCQFENDYNVCEIQDWLYQRLSNVAVMTQHIFLACEKKTSSFEAYYYYSIEIDISCFK